MATLKINGQVMTVDVDESTPLLWVLREQLGLTGTKYGCGIAECGACTIHIDGQSVRSCVYPVGALAGDEEITTIEGLSEDGSHPVQQAWVELDVPQCGYCQLVASLCVLQPLTLFHVAGGFLSAQLGSGSDMLAYTFGVSCP